MTRLKECSRPPKDVHRHQSQPSLLEKLHASKVSDLQVRNDRGTSVGGAWATSCGSFAELVHLLRKVTATYTICGVPMSLAAAKLPNGVKLMVFGRVVRLY